MIPGAPGPVVPPTPCINGSNAWASLAASFTMPAQLGAGLATLDHTDWLALGEPIWIETLGTFQVLAISDPNVFLKNLQDGVGGYLFNAPPGTVAAPTIRVTPTGFQGNSGLPSLISYASVLGTSGPPVSGVTPSVPPLYIDDVTVGGPYRYFVTPGGDWFSF
jgi:hypothetical protein